METQIIVISLTCKKSRKVTTILTNSVNQSPFFAAFKVLFIVRYSYIRAFLYELIATDIPTMLHSFDPFHQEALSL